MMSIKYVVHRLEKVYKTLFSTETVLMPNRCVSVRKLLRFCNKFMSNSLQFFTEYFLHSAMSVDDVNNDY